MVKEIEVMFGKKIMKGNTRKRKRNKMGEGVPFQKVVNFPQILDGLGGALCHRGMHWGRIYLKPQLVTS